ncbi:hypothetical protein B0H10DRAFT_2220511 [Mycena sp. CBHHK59/15]|nr:hypothetical protein B0H10DRAFT_2220511 [Mycena sp. CBHHK59/15]
MKKTKFPEIKKAIAQAEKDAQAAAKAAEKAAKAAARGGGRARGRRRGGRGRGGRAGGATRGRGSGRGQVQADEWDSGDEEEPGTESQSSDEDTDLDDRAVTPDAGPNEEETGIEAFNGHRWESRRNLECQASLAEMPLIGLRSQPEHPELQIAGPDP